MRKKRNRKKPPLLRRMRLPLFLLLLSCAAVAHFSPNLPSLGHSLAPAPSEIPIAPYDAAAEDLSEHDTLSHEELPAGAEISEAVLPEGAPKAAASPALPISAITIDGTSGGYEGAGTVYIKNDTDYAVDIPAMLQQKTAIAYSASEPAVLIVHTHATEAYTPDSANSYVTSDTNRTTDTNYNVVRVGTEIEKILNANGIKTLHAADLNDYPSYNGAYSRTLNVISQYMKKYPSIKFVIDVHRDAMVTASGKKYKTVAQINGRQTAQLMLVAGTDAGGLTHDHWRENLAWMTKLQSAMNKKYPGIMRPINIRAARFNEHVTTGSILLEVGTSGNTLDEAIYSAQLFAQTLSEQIAPLKK